MDDELKSREQLIGELRELRERLARAPSGVAEHPHRILEGMRAMVCEADGRGRMVYVSPNVLDILGYRPDEFLEHDGLELVHPEDAPGLSDLMARARTRAEELKALDLRAHAASKRRIRRALIRKIRRSIPLDLLDAMMMGLRGARPR